MEKPKSIKTGTTEVYNVRKSVSVLLVAFTHLAQWKVVLVLLQEVNVSGRDNAHQLATHFSVVCDGDPAEAVASLSLEDVSHTFIGAHHYRVCDEALFVTLREGRKLVIKSKLLIGKS